MALATTIVTDTSIHITTMTTGLVVRSSSEGTGSTTASITRASVSTGTGLISPAETSATWAALAAATSAAAGTSVNKPLSPHVSASGGLWAARFRLARPPQLGTSSG